MFELKYEYQFFCKILCKNYKDLSICIAIIDSSAPYMSLLNQYCLDIYNTIVEDISEIPLMPYDVKKLKEIGKYITLIQHRYYNSKDEREITYLIETFSYIQETMELPDSFLEYYYKI